MTVPNKAQSNMPEAARLKEIVAAIEALEDDKSEISANIREQYAEAKAEGFAVKILRQVVRRRRQATADRAIEDDLRELYEEMLREELLS